MRMGVDVQYFFLNVPPSTELSTLSLHDALPISSSPRFRHGHAFRRRPPPHQRRHLRGRRLRRASHRLDRKSTRLNSSHANISYAVFCLKKKNADIKRQIQLRQYAHASLETRTQA